MRRYRTGLWKNSDFVKLWLGQTVSQFGSGITGIALPLTAVLVLAATPAQMGILGAVDGIAVLKNPLLRALAGSAATFSLFGNFIGALYALYVIRQVSAPPIFLGFLVATGHIKGWLNQDTSGKNILNWFQDGFYCQVTSSLPISQLADFASRFQVVAR